MFLKSRPEVVSSPESVPAPEPMSVLDPDTALELESPPEPESLVGEFIPRVVVILTVYPVTFYCDGVIVIISTPNISNLCFL